MASDYTLEIEDIKGESGDAKYAGSIEIDSFNWGCRNSGSHATGGGGGAGKVSLDDLTCTTGVNKSAPLLMLFCCNGKEIKKAILHVRKQGAGEQQENYTVTMEHVIVSSYTSGGHSGSPQPTDQFSLNFSKVKFEFKPQKDDQTLDAAVTGSWNTKTNAQE